MISIFFNLIFTSLIIGLALFHQHIMGMDPCAWCVLQRLLFISIFIVSLAGIFLKLCVKTINLIAIVISIVGATAATYQTIWASQSESCGISLAEKIISFTKLNEMIPNVFEAYALCSQSNINLIGIPYSVWAGMGFILILFFNFKNIKSYP